MRISAQALNISNLFVALKITEACNLKCDYCYFFEKKDQSYKVAPKFLSLDLAADVGRFLAKGARDYNIPVVNIALHGGEPLLVGQDRFVKICETLREQILPHAQLVLGVQTNGVLLDEAWIECLSMLDVGIGLSMDGPRHITDAHRPTKSGGSTYDDVLRAVHLLEKSSAAGLIPPFAVISVINPEMPARMAFDFFVHELGLKRIFFRPPSMTWDDDYEPMASFVSNFLTEMFDLWVSKDDPELLIRSNVEAIRPFLHDDAGGHSIGNLVDLAEAISIRSNGDVCPDDSLPPLSEEFRNLNINVRSNSLQDLYGHPVWNSIRVPMLHPPTECAACDWLGVCGGGSLATRFAEKGMFAQRTVYCDAQKSLFNAGAEYVAQQLGYAEVRRRIALTNRRFRELSLRMPQTHSAA